MTTLPPDVHALPLLDLEGHRIALLDGIARRQAAIGALRAPRPGSAPAPLVPESFDRLCVLRSERARLLNQLRRVHELIEAVSCEESSPAWPTPPST